MNNTLHKDKTEEKRIYNLDDKRPALPVGCHPVETGRYLVPTNMIFNLYKEVSKWIKNRAPGAIFYGRPRLGKTKAIEYLAKILPLEFGEKMPIYHIHSREYKVPNEDNFFSHLLEQVGHKLYLSGRSNVKRDRLTKYLVEKGELTGQKRLIMFIDDAQRLREIEYGWLMDLYNELDSYDIKMTAILVGQDEILHQRSSFIATKKAQIVGRFMVHDYKFTGAKSIDDISNFLIGYDDITEYPVGSGWPYTRYFFPESFAQGYRVGNCAEDLYNAFLGLRQEAKLTKSFDIPMQYLTLTVEYAFRNFGAGGDNVEWLNQKLWKESVINSGYINAEIYHETV